MFDSVYSIALSILRELGGDDTVKYDSTYSIALAILDVLGGDTTKKYDSVYSILLDIYKTRFGTDLSGMDSSYSILNEINKAFDPSDTSKYDSSYETLIAISEHMVPAGYVFEIVTDSANTVIINGEQRTSAQFETGTEVSWSVSRTGYVTQSGTYTMGEEDYSLTVTLVVDQFTYTIVPLPADATVVINEQQRSSITADYGTIITWTVSRTGYATQTGSFTLTEDRTDTIGLIANQYTLTINPTPNDATVIINGVERRSYTEDYGTAAVWSVSKAGYVTQSNIDILTSDTTRNITLVEMQYTFSIVPNPADATVMINGVEQSSVNVSDGATLTWSVSKTGYETQTGSYTIDGADHTENVTLVSTQPIITFNKGDSSETLIVNGTVYSGSPTTITVNANVGDVLHWESYRRSYSTRRGDVTVSGNQTVNTSLSEAPFVAGTATSSPTLQYHNGSSYVNFNITYDSNSGEFYSSEKSLADNRLYVLGDKTNLMKLTSVKLEHTENMHYIQGVFESLVGDKTSTIDHLSYDGFYPGSSDTIGRFANIGTALGYNKRVLYINNWDLSQKTSADLQQILTYGGFGNPPIGTTMTVKDSKYGAVKTINDYPDRLREVHMNLWSNIPTPMSVNSGYSNYVLPSGSRMLLFRVTSGSSGNSGWSGSMAEAYNLIKDAAVDIYAYGWSDANITKLKNTFWLNSGVSVVYAKYMYWIAGAGKIKIWIDGTHYWYWDIEDQYTSSSFGSAPSAYQTTYYWYPCSQWTLVDTTA